MATENVLAKHPIVVSRPIDNSYIVNGGRLAAGENPGSPPDTPRAQSYSKLQAFLNAGISAFIDLTEPADGLAPYSPALRALAGKTDVNVCYERFSIRDMDVCGPLEMSKVLNSIDRRLAEGRGVYVHCWGGVGRTGMVIGCWFVRHGHSGQEALRQVGTLFNSMSESKVKRHAAWGSPQTAAQRAMVLGWAEQEPADE